MARGCFLVEQVRVEKLFVFVCSLQLYQISAGFCSITWVVKVGQQHAPACGWFVLDVLGPLGWSQPSENQLSFIQELISTELRSSDSAFLLTFSDIHHHQFCGLGLRLWGAGGRRAVGGGCGWRFVSFVGSVFRSLLRRGRLRGARFVWACVVSCRFSALCLFSLFCFCGVVSCPDAGGDPRRQVAWDAS